MSEMTLLAHQGELEQLYNKNQTLPRIRKEFMDSEINFKAVFAHCGVSADFGFDLLAQMALHKRTTLPPLVGILRSHYTDVQLLADALYRCAECDLLDWNPNLRTFIVRFGISKAVQEDLDRYQYPLPMVIEPQQVKTNRDSGYLFGSSSIILRNNYHTGDVCLDHINRVNKIKFSINTRVSTMVKNTWKDLDRQKPGETRYDFDKRKKAFAKYDRTAKDVIGILTRHGNEFYLTHRYDKRGRVYAQGYHVNYQGNPWNKAVIEFTNKEMTQ